LYLYTTQWTVDSRFSRHAKFGRRGTVTLGTGHEVDWAEPLLGDGSDSPIWGIWLTTVLLYTYCPISVIPRHGFVEPSNDD
jgi:hypothetical protein